MPTDIARLHAIFDLAMRIGEGMLTNGAAASEVTATVLRVLSSSGLRNVVVEVTFNQVSLSYLPDDRSTPFTRIRSAGVRAPDFARLAAFEEVTDRYIGGDLSREEAGARVVAIPQEKPHYSRGMMIAGFALMGGASAFSLGGSTMVVLAATIAAGVLIWLTGLMAAAQVPLFFGQAVGGFVGVLAAVVVSLINPVENSSIVVVACIIVLLAGLTSIGAMQDAITGWYVTASARILETLMLTIGIVAGVRGGLLLAHLTGQSIAVSAALPLSLASVLVLAVSGVVIGIGYGVGTYTPARLLIPMSMAAGTSAVVAHILARLLLDRVWAVAVASFLVGMIAVVLARWMRAPALLFVTGGIIPLVPGSRIYRGLLALPDQMDQGAAELFGAAEIAIAIAAGAVLGQLLASRILTRLGISGWAYTPVVSAPFSTVRRRRLTLPKRRKRDAGRTEPSTMTGEMTALPPSLLQEAQDELDASSAQGPSADLHVGSSRRD
ncbi:threonine/serine exporter family protein [Brachybacterium sp. JHP9]|uniref:Threonine/serine exporter family protein n=1 Tax=Brachybacterium equifaecis TaxID=2910770 RepID=A0ABT0QYZ2_9MICO|nr:threonine/serine exporter family protein [Brachybacterium equifaecis]